MMVKDKNRKVKK